MKRFLLFSTLATSFLASAQKKISGFVLQNDTAALSYVNIGIKQRNIGVVSNPKGEFSIDIPKEYIGDSLTFSYVGYEELTIPISKLKDKTPNIILLETKITVLPTVLIATKQSVQKRIGIKSSIPFLSSPPVSKKDNDVVEFAQYIDIADKPSQILSTSILLKAKQHDTISLRINFYSDQNGYPFQRQNDQNIVVKIPVNTKWVTIDLSSYNIRLNKNFFITYEFLPDGRSHVFTYGAQLGGSVIARHSSLGTWTRQNGGSLSAYVTLRQ